MQTTSTFFQKYQQEHFLDVAIDPNELAPADRPEPGAKYLPQTYLIHSTPEPITVLKTLPMGVRGQVHAFLSNKKSGLLTLGQSRSRAIRTRWIHF